MQNLQINPQRLWDTLMETAQIGATAKGGICRLTLTDLDRQVRDWFKAQCEALGCTVAVDEVGNMFARRPGKNDNLAPIAMHAHTLADGREPLPKLVGRAAIGGRKRADQAVRAGGNDEVNTGDTEHRRRNQRQTHAPTNVREARVCSGQGCLPRRVIHC